MLLFLSFAPQNIMFPILTISAKFLLRHNLCINNNNNEQICNILNTNERSFCYNANISIQFSMYVCILLPM